MFGAQLRGTSREHFFPIAAKMEQTCDHTNLMEKEPYSCNGVDGKACP
jgi:hypothetical protein